MGKNLSLLKNVQDRLLSRYSCIALAIVVWIAAPMLVGNGFVARLFVLVAIFAIGSMSLNLLLGFGGLVSIGHAAFFGIGAYAAALISVNTTFPFLFTVVISATAGSIAGFIVGYTGLRLKGLYFALGTWAFAEILRGLALNLYDITGGSNGIPGISSANIYIFRANTDISAFYLVSVFVIITYFVLNRAVNSRWGRSLESSRVDENVASMMGVNVFKSRVQATVIAGIFTSISGALYAHYERFISPDVFSIENSILFLSMVVLGGRRNLLGSIVGALVLIILPEILRPIGIIRMLIYGVVLLIFILFRPQGLIQARLSVKNK